MDSHCPYLLSGETTFHLTYYLEKPVPVSEGELFNIPK